VTEPRLSYLIYATSRSGSTLLCDVLGRTGLAGAPDEYFNMTRSDQHLPGSTLRPPVWEQRKRELPFPVYVRKIVSETTTPNGVFGAKFSWHTHHHFVRRLRACADYAGMTDRQMLDAFFPNLQYIFLTRRDKVRQAVSAWKALQTGQWNSLSSSSPDQMPKLHFNYGLINDLVSQTIDSEASVAGYLSSIEVVPLTITYEDLALEPARQVSAVLSVLDVDVPPGFSFPQPRLSRQVDDLNERWTQRFLRYKRNETRLARLVASPLLMLRPSLRRWYIPDRLLPLYRRLRRGEKTL